MLGKSMWKLGLRYRKHYNVIGKPDFVFVKAKVAVFCDGDFWHGRNFERQFKDGRFDNNPDFWKKKIYRNRQRDEQVTNQLFENGWLVLRFWTSEILEDSTSVAEEIHQTVKQRILEQST